MECHDQRDLAPRPCTALVHRKLKNSTYMYVYTCTYVHVYIVHIKLSSGIESLHVYSSTGP